jgi:prepilin peptidase CpaA
MNTAAPIFAAIVFSFTLTGAICDVRTRKLPNWLTVSAFFAGMVFQAVVGFLADGWSGLGHQLLFALVGFATGFGILFVMWLIGGSGAGDVKMMGAVGAWLGAKQTFFVFLFSALIVAFATLAIMTSQFVKRGLVATRRRYLSRHEFNTEAQRLADSGRRRIMPYGVPLALSTWSIVAVNLWRQWNH